MPPNPTSIRSLPDSKVQTLVDILDRLGRVAVAYSGGADSAFLLKAARDVLGEGATGVLGFSESLDRNEFEAARRVASEMGIPIEVIETHEYENPLYRRNDANRCYHCKSELFERVREFARERGIPHVLDGSNLDDLADFRPGSRARSEQGVHSPLQEARLSKEEIRRHSRALGLPTWDKPAAPCLSSRIPYGSEIDEAKLRQVESGEAFLHALGFREVRVRHHGQVARLEVPPADFPRLLADPVREQVTAELKRIGFTFVSLDLAGFRSGSMNEALRAAPPPSTVPPPPRAGIDVGLEEVRILGASEGRAGKN